MPTVAFFDALFEELGKLRRISIDLQTVNALPHAQRNATSAGSRAGIFLETLTMHDITSQTLTSGLHRTDMRHDTRERCSLAVKYFYVLQSNDQPVFL